MSQSREPVQASATSRPVTPTCAQLWRAAAAAWDALAEPYPLARALLRAAEADLADGERSAGQLALSRAADLARVLGAAPLLAEIEQLARRARRLPR